MAKNVIKGITVEIGGDTTKLGKALENVVSKSMDLSGELKEVNKLLKLDPGNTDLLAQKQEILSQAIENTAERLKTLKTAEKQVQEQFKRGEVSEEQVRALQREIVSAEAALKRYEKEARETADAVDGLGDSSAEVSNDTKKAEKGADKAADSLDELSDSADKAGKSGEGMGSKFASAAKTGLAAVAGAATAALGALVGAAEATREYRTAMGKLETAFTTAGHSSEAATETYKTLQGILGESDQAVEAANHLAKLTDNEEDLAKWTNIATGVYATFGDSLPIENLTEAANETAKTGALTGGLADALNWAGVNEDEFQAQLDACTTEQERQALITGTLNGLYTEAADKYREVNAEVIRANEANEAWTASMAQAGAAIEPILTDIKMMGAALLTDFLPGIQQVADALRGLLNGDTGAADELGEALSGIVMQLLDKVVELAPTLVQVAMSLITTLVTTLVTLLPRLVTTGVQIITTIIDGLVQAIPQVTQAIVGMIPQLTQALVSGIPQIIQGAVSLFMAILDAIPQIIPPLIAALPQIVMSIVNGLLAAIPQLIQGALQFLLAIVKAIPMLLEQLMPEIPTIVTTVINGLLDAIPMLIDAAITLLMAIVDAIPQILPPLIKALPQIIDAIIDGLIKALPLLLDGAIKLFFAIIDAIPVIVRELYKAMPQIISTILTSIVKAVPKLLSAAKTLLGKILEAAGDLIKKLPGKMGEVITAIVKGIKDGISKVKDVGSDIVKGLWNGIKDMAGWIGEKIKGFGESVLGGIKDFFGIKSPSREMAWVGKMLDEGLAKGIEDNADNPLDAMTDLTGGMLDEVDGLNGLTLDRKLQATFGGTGAAKPETSLLDKLDRILVAIEQGQILTIDGDALVGATADKYDGRLGQRRILAARGAV